MDNSLEQESKSIEQQAFDIYYRCIKQIPDIPEDTIIYHYTSPEGILGITESNSLWATDINSLNTTRSMTKMSLESFYRIIFFLESLDSTKLIIA